MIFAGVGLIVLIATGTTARAMSKGELSRAENLRGCLLLPFGLFPSHNDMKQIKLSGREQAILRAIDYATGSSGEEIRERTQMEDVDIADVLNGLCDVGYVETFPLIDPVTDRNYEATRFEINPSYALQLKEAMKRK